KLSRWFEVLEDLAPITFIAGAAAMTFIDYNQIEEILRVLFVQTRPPFVFCESLINREINFAALDRIAVLNLRACVPELRKNFVFGVVDENVAVGQVKNFRSTMLACFVPPRVPELPANLKCHGRFARTRRHRQKDTGRPL